MENDPFKDQARLELKECEIYVKWNVNNLGNDSLNVKWFYEMFVRLFYDWIIIIQVI